MHSEDEDLVEISIQRLLEDDDWCCLDSEELVELCRIDERLALQILALYTTKKYNSLK